MKKYFIIFLTLFYSCKKEDPVTVSGTLLFSNTLPYPVKNIPLQLFQSGSGGILGGVSSSSADAITDDKGRFTFQFSAGSGYFAGIPTNNNSSVDLWFPPFSNIDTLPRLFMSNFPYATTNSNPIYYLCKKVDTVIIKLSCLSALQASDSLIIGAENLSGEFTKVKTGITAAATTEINLDTLFNCTFAGFDFSTNQYQNRIIIYSPDFSPNNASISDRYNILGKYDEQKIILSYSFIKY